MEFVARPAEPGNNLSAIGVGIPGIIRAKKSMKQQNRSRSIRFRCHRDASALAGILIVLLVMFAVKAGFGADVDGVVIQLARSDHAIQMNGALREDALLVSIRRDGRIFFRNDQVQPSELCDQIKGGLAKGAEKKIYIRADERAHYRSVCLALECAHDSVVEKVSVLTNQR